jgi:hypothetical protein
MFTPVLAKHSKNFNLIHSLEIGVSEMQRNFEPMTQQVNRWRESQLTDVAAKLIIYRWQRLDCGGTKKRTSVRQKVILQHSENPPRCCFVGYERPIE